MKIHLPTTLKAALLASILSAGSHPAFGVTSTTTDYTYTPAGGTQQQTITFNGDIWTWNNNGGKLSAAESTYTNYVSGKTKAGNEDVDPAADSTVPFYNNFFSGSENGRVGNTLRFSGFIPTSDSTSIELNADWHNYAWVGGIITEVSDSDITYTFGRSDQYLGFKLNGIGDVNLLLNSNFTLQTPIVPASDGHTSSVSVEKSGTWTVASGKIFTITTQQTTLAADQVVNINGGGTVAVNSALATQSGSSINVEAGSTLTVSGAITSKGTITNYGTMAFNGGLALDRFIANQAGASLTINGTVNLTEEFFRQPNFLNYSEGVNGYAQGQLVIARGGTTTLGENVTVVGADGTEISTVTLADGSLVTASDYTSQIYFVNQGNQEFSALPAELSIVEGASAELAGVLSGNIENNIYGNGVFTVHFAENGDATKSLNLGNFNGKLRVEGAKEGETYRAVGIMESSQLTGDHVTVELGTAGQLRVGGTFAKDIIVNGESATLANAVIADAEGTLTGNINLNGKTLYKEGSGTLYISRDTAVNSLLKGSEGSTFAVESGTVQIGGAAWTASQDDFTTNLVVTNSTLQLSTSQYITKNFNGTLTLNNGAHLQQQDGGSKFSGAIRLGTAGDDAVGSVTLNVNWGKGGIELAGNVSGGANVYLEGGGSLDSSSTYQYQVINISGNSNDFSGTYHVGANSTNNSKKVHLIAGAQNSLASAKVNLSGGDKAVLSLASAAATVAGLDGTAGSSVITTTNGATLTVNGGGNYAGSFVNVNLTKTGEGTLTLTAGSLTNAVTVGGGTLSLTSGSLTWGDDATVTVNSGNNATLKMGANRGISVTAHAPAMATFAAGDATHAATVTGTEITHADITLTSADDHISQKVTDSSIINSSGAKQTVEVGASLAEVFANTGDIDLLTGTATTLTAGKVQIGSGRTVGVYQGTTDALGGMASLELGDLVTKGSATLNANVTSLNVLTLDGVLNMGGSSLALDDAMVSLGNGFAESFRTSLEGGAESFTLVEGISAGNLSYEGATLATDNLLGGYNYSLGTVAGANGTSSLVITASEALPEPATATLSLLALAALAARRRRK